MRLCSTVALLGVAATLPVLGYEPSKAADNRVEVFMASFAKPATLGRRSATLKVLRMGDTSIVHAARGFPAVDVTTYPAGHFDRLRAMRGMMELCRSSSRATGPVVVVQQPKLTRLGGVEVLMYREFAPVKHSSGISTLAMTMAKHGYCALITVTTDGRDARPGGRRWRTLDRIADEVIRTWRWRWEEHRPR
jgi:hypothetical protein